MRGRIAASQLARRAVVYVRQSTTMQVFENTESTHRQYGLAERARVLGWSADHIDVIDEDLGRSGASTDGRPGFERLRDGIAHGRVGAVFAIEVSRLARSSEDWQRLLSLCAIAEVVVVDENAIYDPADKDDKLILDIKGTMSEAELHWLGLRMHGARQSKARRGELRLSIPTGYVWSDGSLQLDPDQAVQSALRNVFSRFAVEPSAWAVVKWARETGQKFPTRRSYADGTTEVQWKPLGQTRLHEILNNPIYAGTYVYGRRPVRKALVDGEVRTVRTSGRDPEQWAVCIHQAHPGYIDWQTYMSNQKKLRDNVARMSGARRGAPREGSALLQGLLVCGRCGRRMTVNYGGARNLGPYYVCPGERDKGETLCWTTQGARIDSAVQELFLQTMVPSELDLSLAVEREVGAQAGALEQHWKLRLEQANYEARRAERRYKAVDPDNRVVARTLEVDWEQRLRELAELERQYEQAKRERRVELTKQDRSRVLALAHELPRVWRAPSTLPAERKAMLRLVIEAIALTPVEVPQRITRVQVQWKSGAVTELQVARPGPQDRARTSAQAVQRVRELAAQGLRDEQIAVRLNQQDIRTGRNRAWNTWAVKWVRLHYAIERVAKDAPRSRPVPARDAAGRYSIAGAAAHFGVSTHVVRRWIAKGVLKAEWEPHRNNKRVGWIVLDPDSERRAASVARVARRRRSTRGSAKRARPAR